MKENMSQSTSCHEEFEHARNGKLFINLLVLGIWKLETLRLFVYMNKCNSFSKLIIELRGMSKSEVNLVGNVSLGSAKCK